jgi:DNA mismatch endonuclease (patch repair protein)
MMSAVKHKNSKAELLLRKSLFARGLRYRLHSRRLIGKPDIIFPRACVVVFVDSDYWHGRAIVEDGVEAFRATMRTSRADWWVAKLSRNVERDAEVTAALKREGWKVLRVWESDLLKNVERFAERVERAVRRRYKSL